MAGMPYVFAAVPGVFGALLAMIFGVFLRPRFFWLGLMSAGLMYMASFSGVIPLDRYYYEETHFLLYISKFIWWSLPGTLCVVEGIVFWLMRKRQSVFVKSDTVDNQGSG